MTCWSCQASAPEGSNYCPNCGANLSDRGSHALYVVDATTGLFNAGFISALVDQETSRALRYKRPLSIMVVELDHSEYINRDFSVSQRNALLKEIADELAKAVRDVDTVAFLDAEGPPHFGVVMPETDDSGALVAGDKVRRSIAAHEFETGGQWRRLTVSCGLSTVNHEKKGPQELLRLAYEAVVAGRQQGTNRTSPYQQDYRPILPLS